jgi:hypothetical protein
VNGARITLGGILVKGTWMSRPSRRGMPEHINTARVILRRWRYFHGVAPFIGGNVGADRYGPGELESGQTDAAELYWDVNTTIG